MFIFFIFLYFFWVLTLLKYVWMINLSVFYRNTNSWAGLLGCVEQPFPLISQS